MQQRDWSYQYSVFGYYYCNEHYLWRGEVEAILETSNYPALIGKHQGVVQKLVFHSNGNLTGDWDANSCVLARYGRRLMSRIAEEFYRTILRELRACGVSFVGIGSYGVRLRLGDERAQLKSGDIALENHSSNIEKFVRALQSDSWRGSRREQPVTLRLAHALLRGKYYLRAKRFICD